MSKPMHDAEAAASLAEVLVRPSVLAGVVVHAFQPPDSNGEFNGFVDVIQERVEAVKAGDLSIADEMLVSQATALNGLFTYLVHRSKTEKSLDGVETMLRLGLKAQAQCRNTLETLALLKNPQAPSFIRQQNVATNLQVNNGAAAVARAGEIKSAQNELSQDIGAPGSTGAAHRELATVGALDRSEDRRGQGQGELQRLPGRDAAGSARNR